MTDPATTGEVNASLAVDLSEVSAANFRQLIASLAQSGVRRFDPVRFHVIEALASKALEQRTAVRSILEEKARIALVDYQADFLQAQDRCAAIVEHVRAHFPDASEPVRSLFASGDFSAVKRLQARLRRNQQPKPDTREGSALAMLTEQIKRGSLAATRKNNDDSFGALLRQQEDAVLRSFSDARAKGINATSAAENEQPPTDFAGSDGGDRARGSGSVQQFREALAKRAYDKLATRAISEGPEAPGPLNPQALVIRTLAALRELSPDYLNRFVSYADTLLWLEQAGEVSRAAKDKSKNQNREKSRRKT